MSTPTSRDHPPFPAHAPSSEPVLPGVVLQIGNTPLLPLSRVAGAEAGVPAGVEVFAKGEHMNPGGSVKDRPALSMILAAVKSGALTRDKTLLDATSGNTGIAYAMIGAAMGFKVAMCLPKNASRERKKILRVFGCELIETDPLAATDGAQMEAAALAKAHPDRYYYCDQYNNPENWRAHFRTTAPEVWEQTRGRVTHFIAGLGTSGTFVGTSRGLKGRNPQIQCLSMQPDSPIHGLEGMKHMETAIVPGIYDSSIADGRIEVGTLEAQEMARRLAREEGLFVGVTAGANAHAAAQLARTLKAGSVVVTVLCDAGSRYVGDEFWNERPGVTNA